MNMGFDTTNFGFVNDNNYLSYLYSAADVFVFPSIYEAFGKTVVESMSCGTPVVAFDNSGPSELIEHKKNGYLASAFNSKDLAIGISWLAENKNWNSISNDAINRST
jgi:glycosyltransferase involved in cell wall biosynthesis